MHARRASPCVSQHRACCASPCVRALQAILNGSRDRSLAAVPDLDDTLAAEILLLVEKLEQTGVPEPF